MLVINFQRYYRRLVQCCQLSHKFIRMGEYFMHKWCHVPCIMMSSTIPPISVLNIWICRGLTALLVLVNVLSDLFHFWFVFHLLLYSTVCYFGGSAWMYCIGTQIPLLGKGTPDCGFQGPRVRWKVWEVWLTQHRELHLKLSGGGDIYWREAYNTNLIVGGIY